MHLAVVGCGGANYYSIEVALQRLGVSYQLTTDPLTLAAADGVILPGVGSAAFAMAELAKYGLVETLRSYRKPLLGICLGMQLLYEHSAEGNVACLGIFPGTIRRFKASADLLVPHMGWNNLTPCSASPLLHGLGQQDDVYFVHSYFAPQNEVTIASCNYGVEFAALAQQGNFYGMQFHPEKSATVGEKLLNNFIEVVHDHLSGN